MKTLSVIRWSTLATAVLLTSVSLAQPPRGERPGGREGAEGRGAEGRGAEGRGGGEGRGGRGGPGARGGAEGRGGAEMMMRLFPVMAALDADKDGVISKAEIDNAAVALRGLDKDGDGSLTADELRPTRPEGGGRPGGAGGGRPGGDRPGGDTDRGPRRPGGEAGAAAGNRGQFMTRMFQQRDADGDGKLSGDEIPEQLAGRLDRIDTDGDKAISEAELKTAGEAISRMREGGGRGAGGAVRGSDAGGDRPKRPGA